MAGAEISITSLDEEILEGSNGNNELLLYSYHHCFYTQKVLMALYEKKIPFATKSIDITKQEQYQFWFLKINPRGEVPVLKDGIKFIPDSGRIIDYLEDNFSNGDHQRLIPIDQGPEIKQKVIKFHADIDSIPVNIITIGALFHDEFCSNLKYPFIIPPVKKLLKDKFASERSSIDALRNLSLKMPEYQETFIKKALDLEETRKYITERQEFYKLLQQVNDLLVKVENELSTHDGRHLDDWWLCTDRFTIADIALALLLDRLSRVGLENYFWGKGKRPNVEKYYCRIQRRDCYRKTIPSFMTDIAVILRTRTKLIFGISLLTALTVIIGGFLYYKN